MNHNLLVEIQRFAMGKSLYHQNDPAETIQLVKIALKLLEELPVLRDSILDYFSLVFDAYIGNFIKQDKNMPITESDERIISMIKDGLEKLILEQSWAPTYVSQWTLSRLIKPSVEYAKILNLDFKGSCNLWLGCTATRKLLELCGLCFNSFDDTEMKRFIFDLENVFVDNRPNFDWCVAHLSSLFPMKFISNILRMPSMLTPAFIPSTVTVLEYLSNTGEQKLRILLREIVEEALNGDANDLKSKDYIPNLIQLSSKSEIYAQSVLNLFLEYVDKDSSSKFIEKIKRQIQTRPLDYNPDKLHDILPELILRSKENGTRLLLTLIESFENNLWTIELVELVIIELETMIYNDDKTCSLVNDIRKEKNWPLLWKACMSHKKLLQQTAIRLILLASKQRNPIIYCKTIERLLSENTFTRPHIFNALIRLLDDNIGGNETPDINIPISHALQQLSIDLNNAKLQNKCYFILKNLVDIVTLEKDGQCVFLKRGLVTAALQSSVRTLIEIWENALRKVMHVKSESTKNTSITEASDENDPMEIADIDSECVFGTRDQIHMLTNLINHLNLKIINISNAARCEKVTVKYFFWSLTETDAITKSIIMERCFILISKQCAGKKGIRTIAIRDLLEGALFLYPDIFSPKSIAQNNNNVNTLKEESLLKLNQRQIVSLNFSKSSILLHSGVIGSGISKNTKNQVTNVNDVDDETKNFYIKAIVSCCQDDTDELDEDKSKILDGLCNVSALLVELVSTDVMYNGLNWPIDDDFAKVTMERDLHVRRIFKNCPILWAILGLLAQYRVPLWCNCSVFLRALCGSIMHHWRAKAENRNDNNEELMFFTVKFLELLALAKLLPPPLNNLHIVVVYLEPSEIAYVLKECVWNYFVAKGLSSYGPEPMAEIPSDQFINPLRNTMQKKLSILGNLYYQMKFN